MCVWRKSLLRTKSAIISWAGSNGDLSTCNFAESARPSRTCSCSRVWSGGGRCILWLEGDFIILAIVSLSNSELIVPITSSCPVLSTGVTPSECSYFTFLSLGVKPPVESVTVILPFESFPESVVSDFFCSVFPCLPFPITVSLSVTVSLSSTSWERLSAFSAVSFLDGVTLKSFSFFCRVAVFTISEVFVSSFESASLGCATSTLCFFPPECFLSFPCLESQSTITYATFNVYCP